MMVRLSSLADAITVRTHDAVPVVEVMGDLDIHDLCAFEAALEQALRADSQDIVVSLARATYFNSGGIRVLMRLAERLKQENRHLLLVAPRNHTPRRLLDIVYLTSDLLPFESVEDALTAIANERTLLARPGRA
jgi:anti-anti-sigma factor